VVRNELVPEQRPWSFALALWPFYLAFLALPLVTATFLVAGAARLADWPELPGPLLRLTALATAVVVGFENAQWLGRAFSGLPGPGRHRALLPLCLLLVLAGFLVAALSRLERKAPLRLLTGASLLAFLVAEWPSPARPAPSASARAMPRPLGANAPTAPPRFLLFGLDGADWRYAEPLLARGELPNLAGLRARGVFGPLKSMRPTGSPIIWTTVATGQPPEVHGIEAFTIRQVRGVNEALPARLRGIRGLGFRSLEALLERFQLIHTAPVAGTARRVPAYWDIASRFRSPVTVLNWWATWPAEPVLGAMVSERLYFWRFAERGHRTAAVALIHPPELLERLRGLVMRPDEVGYDAARRFMDVLPAEFEAMKTAPFDGRIRTEFRYLFSMLETNRRIAPVLMEWSRRQYGQTADLLMIERAVDIACHDALRESELVQDHLGATPDGMERFSRVVTEAYRSADRVLGELMAAFGEGNVLVISDHGFELEREGLPQFWQYNHSQAPDGIFVAAGPAFGHGPVEGLSVYDMLPLLLFLKGFPIAEDLPGRLPREVFAQELRRRPATSVPSYGTRERSGAWSGPPAMDEEMLERLRALGYVQ